MLDAVEFGSTDLAAQMNQQFNGFPPLTMHGQTPTQGFSFCSGRANCDAAADLLVVQPPVKGGRNGNGDTCCAIPGYKGNRAAWTISNGRLTARPEEQRHLGYRQLVILAR